MLDVIIDALLDSLKILPYLFLVYFVIEFIESRTAYFFKEKQNKSQKFGPLLGSFFGIIPQCGFGVIGTKLFSKRHITIGTLMAIYLATSDEAIPLMIANEGAIKKLLPFILIKGCYAFIIGYIFDLVIFRDKRVSFIEEKISDEEVVECCGHEIANRYKKFIIQPLIHAFKIFIFIFIINLLLGITIYFIGEDSIASFMQQSKYLQPLFSVIVGLIPNCASSVLITQLYIADALTFGATMAGLCANAGIALAVLFKQNKNIKENIIILIGLIVSSLLIGYLLLFIF